MLSVINFQTSECDQASHRFLNDNCASNRQSSTSDKKVGFLDTVQYNDHPTSPTCDAGQNQSRTAVRPIASSAKSLPLKGILKPSYGYIQISVTNMLQSHLKALAGSDIHSRSDAYVNLSNMIRAFDKTPDSQFLINNVSEICQYIERDLLAVHEDGKPNQTLISQALTLVISLQYKPMVVESFPTKFRVRLVEYAIKVLEDQLAPRDVIDKVIFMMARQEFSPKVMTSERLGNLLMKLNSTRDNKKGKRFLLGRLEIYQNLFKFSKSLMAIHTAWISDILCDMNSSLKDVQLSAIKFGFQAAVELGANSSVSGALIMLFKSKLKEDELFGTMYSQILMKKARQIEQAIYVPQIWSILILFQRHRPQIFAQSPYMKSFLAALTLCFNQKDIQVQKQAQYAWNRFIYVVQLSEKTPKPMREMLIRPCMQSLLHQRSSHISGSFYNLLYYAFRPGCSPLQLDLYWDEFVMVLISQSLASCESNRIVDREATGVVVKILMNIFDIKTPRKWNEKKAVENFGPNEILADELPALDSKWLRKNTSRAFLALLNIFNRLFWDFSDYNSMATKVWANYINSIASPAVMEVKVSLETINCISNVLKFLNQRWDSGITDRKSLPYLDRPQDSNEFLQSFQTIICITISGLGALSFSEKLLSFSQGVFTPVTASYQHSTKTKIICKSPIAHLLYIFTKPCPGLENDLKLGEMIDSILKLIFETRRTLPSVLGLIMEFCQTPLEDKVLIQIQILWQALSKQLILILNMSNSKTQKIDSEDFSKIVDLLKFGIKISPSQPLSGWKLLFQSVSELVTFQTGYSEKALSIIEPLSEFLLQMPNELLYLELLISNVEYVKSFQELGLKGKNIDRMQNPICKINSPDPYLNFYKYLNASLITTYNSKHENYDIIVSTNTFLSRCPDELLLGVLIYLKDGVASWIVDDKSKLNCELQLHTISSLWSTINSLLIQIIENPLSNDNLQDIETIICFGLKSKNRQIVEMTVEIWDVRLTNLHGSLKHFKRLKNMAHSFRSKFPGSKLNSLPKASYPSNNPEKIQEYENIDNHICNNDLGVATSSKHDTENQRLPTSPKNTRGSTPQVVIKVKNISKNLHKERKGRLKTNVKNPDLPRNDYSDSSIQSESDIPLASHIFDSQTSTRRWRQKLNNENPSEYFDKRLKIHTIEDTGEKMLPMNQSISVVQTKLDSTSSQQLISIKANKQNSTSNSIFSTSSFLAEETSHKLLYPDTWQEITHDSSSSIVSPLSSEPSNDDSLRISSHLESHDSLLSTSSKSGPRIKKQSKLHLPKPYSDDNKTQIDTSSLAQEFTSNLQNNVTQISSNKEIDCMEFAETQDTVTPVIYEGRVYNYSSSAGSKEVLPKMIYSKSEKPQGKKLICINVETESSTEKEKTSIDSQKSDIIDDISYDETSPLKSSRLQGICSSPISLPSSSIRLNSRLDFISGRTGSLSPDFHFPNDLSAFQPSKLPTEYLIPLAKQKDASNDEKLQSSLMSNIISIDPNQKILHTKTLATNDLQRTPKNSRKSTTNFLDEFQPPVKQIIEMENNQLTEESSKKSTLISLQTKEIVGLERSSRSSTRKRKFSARNKSERHSENCVEQKQKKPSRFKRRRICKDPSEGNSTQGNLDIRSSISLNDESEDERISIEYAKNSSDHNSNTTDGRSKNRNYCDYLSDNRYPENDDYTSSYGSSTQTQIIQPSRSPVITRNVSSNLKKASTQCTKKWSSKIKNSPLRKNNDRNTQISSKSLTKLQQQQLERLNLAEDDRFELDPTATVKEVYTNKATLSISSIYPTDNNVTTLHQTNNEKIQITTTNSITTNNNTSTNQKSQELSSDSENTHNNPQNPSVPLPLPNHNKFCRDIILGKLDLLISVINQADLRKGDVSLIEDKMMDAKRALYEAERRGRST
ncbi:putative telomere length regulator protein [Erysiphe neolycopersici]|uniref:Putative telomere length regulator protein n=1 Tax=Erysiphe neolycopersici TaxID=212602 RepID=A0A420I2Y6_9PEZI|nr:putative telomere length regulator protein [Erysiphe neolycopersici]